MKAYKISQLKANISEALRYVKKGNTIQILDRETPVANLTPISKDGDQLKIRLPINKSNPTTLFVDIRIKGDGDIQKILQEDRKKR